MHDSQGKAVFLCKELGVTYLHKDVGERYTFCVESYKKLAARVKNTIRWVTRNIHGLRFEDKPDDMPQDQLSDVLHLIQAIGFTESGRKALAFKGGICERDALYSAGIPCYDLESVGCPKFSSLLDMYDVKSNITCGLHRYNNPGVVVHCPVTETMFFRRWLLQEEYE